METLHPKAADVAVLQASMHMPDWLHFVVYAISFPSVWLGYKGLVAEGPDAKMAIYAPLLHT